MKQVSVFISILFFTVLVFADQSELLSTRKSGGAPAAFLQGVYGAKAAGMGGMFCAMINSLDAGMYNPAGLTELNHSEIILASSLQPDNRYSFAAGRAWLVDYNFKRAAAFYVKGMYTGGIQGYDASGNPDGEYTFLSAAPEFVYARQDDLIGIGFGIKGIYENGSVYQSLGIGGDVGADIEPPILGGTVGITISDIGIMYDMADKQPRPLHPLLRCGYIYRLMGIDVISVGLGFSKQLAHRGTSFMFGGEYAMSHHMAVRSGIDGKNISFGGSAGTKAFHVDYAIQYNMILQVVTHTIGIVFSKYLF